MPYFVTEVDWETWFHTPGMPKVTPDFSNNLSSNATELAQRWIGVSRGDSTEAAALQLGDIKVCEAVVGMK